MNRCCMLLYIPNFAVCRTHLLNRMTLALSEIHSLSHGHKLRDDGRGAGFMPYAM